MRLPSPRKLATALGGLVAGLPDEVLDQLVSRSDGVPLYAVETVRSLIDRDLVVAVIIINLRLEPIALV